jgi:hypothetical protein
VSDTAWDNHPRTGLTVTGWFKSRGTEPGIQTLVAKSGSWWLHHDGANHTITFGLNGPEITGTNRGESPSIVTRALEQGQWHHIAAVYDGQQVSLYLDGKEERALNASGPLALSTAPVTLGDDTLARGRLFNGWMDDVRIHHRALSPGEIQTLHRAASE